MKVLEFDIQLLSLYWYHRGIETGVYLVHVCVCVLSKTPKEATTATTSVAPDTDTDTDTKVTCAAGFDRHSCNNPLHVQQVQRSLSEVIPEDFTQVCLGLCCTRFFFL